MRALVLIFALAAAAPIAAQADPTAAPAKPKRVCRFVDTGNPMKIDRVCHTVAATAVPASAAVTAATTPAANTQVALAEKPPR